MSQFDHQNEKSVDLQLGCIMGFSSAYKGLVSTVPNDKNQYIKRYIDTHYY